MRTMMIMTVVSATALLQGSQAAQTQDMLGMIAMGMALYEDSRDECYYAPVVGEAFASMNETFSASDPYLWQLAKHQAKGSPSKMQNLLSITGAPDDRCGNAAFLISQALLVAPVFAGNDPALLAEIERLRSDPRKEAPSTKWVDPRLNGGDHPEQGSYVNDPEENEGVDMQPARRNSLQTWAWPEKLRNDEDNGCIVTKPIDDHMSFAVYANPNEGFGIGLLIPGEMLEVGRSYSGAATFDDSAPVLLQGSALSGDLILLDSGAEEDSVQGALGPSKRVKLTIDNTSVELSLDGYEQAIDRLWECAESG